MIVVARLDAVAYRVHDPKWAFAPTSGAGAGKHGGRANRPGVNALYLSLELETALVEYRHLDALLPPALMVSYRVNVGPIIDFRDGFTNAWDALWQHFYCNWRKMYFKMAWSPHHGRSAMRCWLPVPRGSCSGRFPPATQTSCCSMIPLLRPTQSKSTTRTTPSRKISPHGISCRKE